MHSAVCISFYRPLELHNKIRKYSNKASIKVIIDPNEKANESSQTNNTLSSKTLVTIQDEAHVITNSTAKKLQSSNISMKINDFHKSNQLDTKLSECEHEKESINDGEDHLSTHTKSSSFWSDLLDFSVLKNLEYDAFLLSIFSTNIGFIAFFTHYLSRAVHLGIDRNNAIVLQTTMGLCMGIGRYLTTFAVSFQSVPRELLFGVLIVVISAIELSFPVAETFVPLLIYGILHGLCGGKATVNRPLNKQQMFAL